MLQQLRQHSTVKRNEEIIELGSEACVSTHIPVQFSEEKKINLANSVGILVNISQQMFPLFLIFFKN